MSLSRALPDILPRNGWYRWRVEPWAPLMALCCRFASLYMTATPSSALPFEPCCALPKFNLMLPARSPNLNAFAERWVRSIKNECLSKLILFGETSLRRALGEFLKHYHRERNHQGKDNLLLFPAPAPPPSRPTSAVTCHERLGGLLNFYQLAG